MNDPLIRAIHKLTAPLQRRIHNMVARGVITALKDSEGLQLLQATLTSDEVMDGAERLQEYGFTSNPPLGSEIVALFLGGGRDHPVVLAVDNRAFRLTDLDSGDSAIYSLLGNFIKTKADGAIEITGIAGNTVALTPNGDIILACAGGNTVTMEAAGDTTIHNPTGTLRLDAANVELHGTASLKFDAGGNGVHYTPTTIHSFTIGATSSASPLNPPEIP